MPGLSTSPSILLQQLHFILKHWSRKGRPCTHSLQRGKTRRPLSQYTPSHLFFQTADEHPKHSAVVSVSSWLSEYWIIYHSDLASDSNTSFTHPSSQWAALNSPHAATLPTYLSSYLCYHTNPATALKQEKKLGMSEDWATDTTAARGLEKEDIATSARTRSNSSILTLTSSIKEGAECRTQLSGPSSFPPENRWQARWKHPLGHFQPQQLAESLKQEIRKPEHTKKPKMH